MSLAIHATVNPWFRNYDVLEVETARTLSYAIRTETCAWAVGSSGVKGCAWMHGSMLV